MNFPPPICACCREPLGDVWALTQPAVYLICGAGSCEAWATAQRLSVHPQGRLPAPAPTFARRRAKTNCDGCGGDLPRPRDQFRDGDRRYCSLTCAQ